METKGSTQKFLILSVRELWSVNADAAKYRLQHFIRVHSSDTNPCLLRRNQAKALAKSVAALAYLVGHTDKEGKRTETGLERNSGNGAKEYMSSSRQCLGAPVK